MSGKHLAGFTLIELMIILTIIGVLTSLAVPQYSKYVQSSRRSDAVKSMSRILAQQELYYANNGSTYTSVVANIGYALVSGDAQKTQSEDGHYLIRMSGCGAGISDCVSLNAVPAASSSQSKDYYCTSMAINSRGQTGESYNSSKVTPATGFSCWN